MKKRATKKGWLLLIVPILAVWIIYAVSCSGVQVVVEIPVLSLGSVFNEYVMILTGNATPSDHMTQNNPLLVEGDSFDFLIKKGNGIRFIVTFTEDPQQPQENATHFQYSIDLTDTAEGTYAITITAARQASSHATPRNAHEAQIWIQISKAPPEGAIIITLHEEIPGTTDEEEIIVLVRTEQPADEIEVDVNGTKFPHTGLEPTEWVGDEPVYAVPVQLDPGSNRLEIQARKTDAHNERGGSLYKIIMNVERHGIRATNIFLSECDGGSCTLHLVVWANYITLDSRVSIGEEEGEWAGLQGGFPEGKQYPYSYAIPVPEGNQTVTISVRYSHMEGVVDTISFTVECDCSVPTPDPQYEYGGTIGESQLSRVTDMKSRGDGSIAILNSTQSGPILYHLNYSESPVPAQSYSIQTGGEPVIGIADYGHIQEYGGNGTVIQTSTWGAVYGPNAEWLFLSYDPTGSPLPGAVYGDPGAGKVLVLTENQTSGEKQIETKYPGSPETVKEDIFADPRAVDFLAVHRPGNPLHNHLLILRHDGQIVAVNMETGEENPLLQLPIAHGNPEFMADASINDPNSGINFGVSVNIGAFCVSQNQDGSFTYFFVPSPRIRHPIRSDEPVITRVAFDADGRMYFSRSDLPGIEVWLRISD